MAELLVLEGVASGYGESVVVEEARLALAEGETATLLGRNGAGKSTLLTTMMGLTRLHRGVVRWRGKDISRSPAHARARAGMGWVPQERGMWRSLTVEEHLACVARPGPWTVERAEALFPRLAERRRHRGSELSGGEQQMLAIARALVTNPSLLLLDEPMEGLAPIVVQELAGVLRELMATGAMAVVLVEQHPRLALSLAPRALVMERGRIVHDGPSDGLLVEPARLDRWLAVS
jgi:branched-chain amino acid transport system ATP-binding protein